MGVTCQILINRPRKGVHKAGNPVTGIVRYTLDKPDRYKEITISLIGKGKCTWEETKRNHRRNRAETITYIGKQEYTQQHLSIHEKGPEGDIILADGTYERPFHFVLPNNIPSSFKNKICTIAYKLVLKFVKPSFFSINSKFDSEIEVIGNVYTNAPEGITVMDLKKNLFSLYKSNKRRVYLETEIPNSIFRPKEEIPLNFKVKNDSNIIIKSVKTELIRHSTFTADNGKRIEKTKTIKECTTETPSVPDYAVANLTSKLKLTDFCYTIQYSRIMTNDYYIQVTVRLPVPYINASMKIPIVIGEKDRDDEVEVVAIGAEVPMEEPPSYFEVMNKGKDED